MDTWRARLGAGATRAVGLAMVLLLGAAVWLPPMHLVFEPRLPGGIERIDKAKDQAEAESIVEAFRRAQVQGHKATRQ